MNAIRIALAQINATVGDLSGNSKKILANIRKAKSKGADVVVFPELAITGYPPEDLLHKPKFIEDNLKSLKSLVGHTGNESVDLTNQLRKLINAKPRTNGLGLRIVTTGGRLRIFDIDEENRHKTFHLLTSKKKKHNQDLKGGINGRKTTD